MDLGLENAAVRVDSYMTGANIAVDGGSELC